MASIDLCEFEQFVRRLCAEAGAIVRPHFRNPELAVELKSDESPVTVADRQAELRMRELITAQYPSHGIIGEEFGRERDGASLVWVLDPIDGTKSFVAGCPLFGTLVCLLQDGQPRLGAIYQPILEQLMIGTPERTTLNGRLARVRATSQLDQATLLLTDVMDVRRHQHGRAWQALAERVALVRTWGDCYGYLLLASGYADIMLDPIMAPWDLLPLVPILRGAGAAVSDWQGNDAVAGNSIVATAPALHESVIRALNP